MTNASPVSMHKIIFTITCEGETLYDAQKLATNVSAAIEDGYKVIQDGVTIEMTVEKTVIPLDNSGTDSVSILPNDIQLSWTETV